MQSIPIKQARPLNNFGRVIIAAGYEPAKFLYLRRNKKSLMLEPMPDVDLKTAHKHQGSNISYNSRPSSSPVFDETRLSQPSDNDAMIELTGVLIQRISSNVDEPELSEKSISSGRRVYKSVGKRKWTYRLPSDDRKTKLQG